VGEGGCRGLGVRDQSFYATELRITNHDSEQHTTRLYSRAIFRPGEDVALVSLNGGELWSESWLAFFNWDEANLRVECMVVEDVSKGSSDLETSSVGISLMSPFVKTRPTWLDFQDLHDPGLQQTMVSRPIWESEHLD